MKQLIEDFARYLYLPRLRGPEVLVEAVSEGIGRLTWSSETFGFADSWDERKGYAAVHLTLEIEADLPEGAADNVVRIVTENARTLKFRSQGFAEE